jgi:hypothetical protein
MKESIILGFQIWSVLALVGATILCISENRKEFIYDFVELFSSGVIEILLGLAIYYVMLPFAIIYFIKNIVEKWRL